MSLSYRDGQYYRMEVTPEEKRKALTLAEEDRSWVAKNTTVVPAEGKVDPSASWRPLIEQFGTSFLDELRAAQGSGRLLLCEDLLLRQMAFLDFRVPGTWLQPVLMRALSMKVITEDEYRNAVVQLIEAGLEFISVSPDLLVSSRREWSYVAARLREACLTPRRQEGRTAVACSSRAQHDRSRLAG
jgi:hypothetical protein